MEVYGATKKMASGERNEDAFTIIRDPHFIVAVADGSGRAFGVATRALAYLAKMVRNTCANDLKLFHTWECYAASLDAYLEGGKETTLVAATVIGEGVYGIQVGDSRCYKVNSADFYLNSVGVDTKKRLGSGVHIAAPIHTRLQSEDWLIFATDGAWTTFDRLSLQKAQREAQHFSDIPTLLLQQAARHGGAADDMTIVVVRR